MEAGLFWQELFLEDTRVWSGGPLELTLKVHTVQVTRWQRWSHCNADRPLALLGEEVVAVSDEVGGLGFLALSLGDKLTVRYFGSGFYEGLIYARPVGSEDVEAGWVKLSVCA